MAAENSFGPEVLPELFRIRERLHVLIYQYKIRSIIEVGSLVGAGAAFFAAHSQVKSVTCIDPFQTIPNDEYYSWWSPQLRGAGIPNPWYHVFEANLKGLGLWHKIRVLRGYSWEMASQVEAADMVYVDDYHSYENCKRTTQLYLPKAKILLTGDDHHNDPSGKPYYPGVVQSCQELLTPGYQVDGGTWWYDVNDPTATSKVAIPHG